MLLTHREVEPGIAYVVLNSFGNRGVVAEFEALLPKLRESDGVILDLRGNSGGSLTTGKLILRHFVADTLLGFVWRTREHRGAFKAWGRWAAEDPWARRYEDYARGTAWHTGAPDTLFPAPGPPIRAPLVILIGHGTASAGEDLLVFLDGTRRAVLVGQPTNGSSGEPLFFDLPGGGTARIVSYRETYPDGRRTLIDQGVQPDVRVEPTVEDIHTGRDPILEKGMEVLRNAIRCACNHPPDS
jgi:C-terminal processing protease CtpA/Prc